MTKASAIPQLFLKEHAFVCLTHNTLVFLDLHNDKYSCLEPKHTVAITTLLGLPTPSTQTAKKNPDALNKDKAKVIQDLIDNGLATRNPNEGKQAVLIPKDSELREMPGYLPGEGPKIYIGHLFNFFKALIITKCMLRFFSMERTVLRVKNRKDHYYAKGGAKASSVKINELVEVYKILKPLFVTIKDECLFNSLFLIEFLAYYNIYPSWYFGVRLNEFYAHCWVQNSNIIYDDSIVSTSANQPIMAV